MPLVAEVIDAVIGGDTHRDTHALEMTAPTGATIATIAIDNNEGGFAEALAWIAEHTPDSRVVVGLEGTRSYGIGLALAVQAAWHRGTRRRPDGRRHPRRGRAPPIRVGRRPVVGRDYVTVVMRSVFEAQRWRREYQTARDQQAARDGPDAG